MMSVRSRSLRACVTFLAAALCVLIFVVKYHKFVGSKILTNSELIGEQIHVANEFISLTSSGNIQGVIKNSQNDSRNISQLASFAKARVTTLQQSLVKIIRNHSADTKSNEHQQHMGNLTLHESSFTPQSELARLVSNYDEPRFMTLHKSRGRMGNNLFQYAMLLSTARRYGYTPVVSPQFRLTKYLEILGPEVKSVNPTNKKTFGEKGSGIYNPKVANLDTNYNWSLSGFFQSWRYHDNLLLDSAIKLKPDLIQPAKKFITENRREGKKNVCIHVRRGDFVHRNKTIEFGFDTAGVDYITKAMTHFRQKYFRKVLFIVLSDGMDWCKENIKDDDVIYSTFKDPGYDMALMSMCDHVIITSGSFGWWGGRLCGGEVVYWKGYPRPGSPLAMMIFPKDYYPPHWKRMG